MNWPFGNIFAPTKSELLAETPETNLTYTYKYNRWENSSYWTAIYMAYRFHKTNPMGAGIAAWDAFDSEMFGEL